jgi:hypothetical protein
MSRETHIESIAGEIINQKLGKVVQHISVHSKMARPTCLVVDQLDAHGVGEEQDSLVFGIVYGWRPDVALDASDRFPFAWYTVIQLQGPRTRTENEQVPSAVPSWVTPGC